MTLGGSAWMINGDVKGYNVRRGRGANSSPKMAAASLSRIAALLLGLPLLTFASHVPVQPGFNLKKFAGEWFPIAVVGKEAPIRDFSAHMFDIVAERSGGISIYLNVLENDDCTRILNTYREHGQPGIYALTPRGGKDFVVVQTDYTTYAVVLLDNNRLQLFSRKHRSNVQMRKIFDDLAAANGFSVEKIFYPFLKKPCYEL